MKSNKVIADKYLKVFIEKYLNSSKIKNDSRTLNKGRKLSDTFVKFNKNSNINNAKEISLSEPSTWIANSYKNAYKIALELEDLLSQTDNATFSYSISIILNKDEFNGECFIPKTLSTSAVFIKPFSYGISDIYDNKVMDEYFDANSFEYIVNMQAFMEALNEFNLKYKLYFEDLVNYVRVKVDNFYELDDNIIKGNNVIIEISSKQKERTRK